MSTSFLANFPLIFGFGIMLLGHLIGRWIYGDPNSIPKQFSDIWLALGLLIISISGIVIIVRKESPRIGFPSITGWFAVAIGVMWTCMMMSGVIVILINLFS